MCQKRREINYEERCGENLRTSKKVSDIFLIYKKFLEVEGLENQKVLLCVSGGVDSMVLLEVATNLQKASNLAVFHLDHGHRPESQEEQKFLKKICEQKKIQFYPSILENFEQKSREKKLIKNRIWEKEPKNKSLENFWRTERKKKATISAQKFGAARVLTAHHGTDLVETMIFRLTKGVGLSGMAPFDIHTKPFWKVPKTEIRQFAQAKNLVWFEDTSNQNIFFQRNLIHQKILPELRKITPNLEKVFAREHEIFAETQNFLDQIVNQKLKTYLKEKQIDLSLFLGLESFLQKNLLRIIAQETISFGELNNVLAWLQTNPKGNTQKKIGKNHLELSQKTLYWG